MTGLLTMAIIGCCISEIQANLETSLFDNVLNKMDGATNSGMESFQDQCDGTIELINQAEDAARTLFETKKLSLGM